MWCSGIWYYDTSLVNTPEGEITKFIIDALDIKSIIPPKNPSCSTVITTLTPGPNTPYSAGKSLAGLQVERSAVQGFDPLYFPAFDMPCIDADAE